MPTPGGDEVGDRRPEVVGNAAARAIHGFSRGADVVVLGAGTGGGATSAVLELTGPGHPSYAISAAELAAVAAARADRPLVVVAQEFDVAVPALLDLLDDPRVDTAALVGVPDQCEGPGLVRVGADGALVESVGTGWHAVSRPTHAFSGALRVSAVDRPRAAHAWHVAAAADGHDVDPVALALLALVRTGVRVRPVSLASYEWSRGSFRASGAPGSPWKQRLRASSRADDGFLSTFLVRPLSRRLTAVGLHLGWSPNAVTVSSLVLGLFAAGLVLTGERWAWVVAALLLFLALVVDCVDGEIARFTRRFSPFGAWLDAVGDRVKEYAVLAAVAAVAFRRGEDLWVLAAVTMAIVSARHFEDYANTRRLASLRVSRPVLLPLDDRQDGEPAARHVLLPPATTREKTVHWAKKVVHLPIAERYVVLCLGLLTFSPRFLLWLLIGSAVVALLWTQGGRAAAILLGQAPAGGDDEVDGSGRTRLDHQLDLTPWGRSVLRRLLLAHRLAWQGPALVWLGEAAAYCLLATELIAPQARGVVFGLMSAIAYHRYDMGYRLRDIGEPPAPWAATLGLGADGRLAVVVAVGLLARTWLPTAIALLTVWLVVVWLTESAIAWRGWLRAAAERSDDPGDP
jgi:hypothetical protein